MPLKRISDEEIKKATRGGIWPDAFDMDAAAIHGAQAQLEADIKEHKAVIREIFEAGQILWVRADFASRLENAAVRAFVHEIGRDLQALKQKYLHENKYSMYEALKGLAACFRNIIELELHNISDEGERNILAFAVKNMNKALAEVEEHKS